MKPRTHSIAKVAAIFAISFFSMISAQATEVRVGHVSLARIMRESSTVKAVDAKLKKELSKREKELGAIADKLKKKAAKLDKDMPVLAESERTTRQRELAELEQEWKLKRQSIRQDMSQRQSEESAAFSKQLNAALKKVADTEKLDIVIQDAAYFNPKIDVTDKVLAELNN